MLRACAAAALLMLVQGCGPSVVCEATGLDPRCCMRPPRGADYGTCAMIIGCSFALESGTCGAASGCGCDAACRASEIPFSSQQECESVCLPARR